MRHKLNSTIGAKKPPVADLAAGMQSFASGQTPLATTTVPESRAICPDLHTLRNIQPCHPALENNMNSTSQPFQPSGVLDDIQWMKRVVKIICLIILGLFVLARIEHWDPGAYPDVPDLQDEIRGQETGFVLPDDAGDKNVKQVVALGCCLSLAKADLHDIGH
jgi:hypothetical protein